MAVLAFLLLSFLTPAAFAQMAPEVPIEILYDRGNPDNSVVIIDHDLYEINDIYRIYKLHAVEPEAIVLEDQSTNDRIRLSSVGEANDKARTLARHTFVVKQLRAIREAQVVYLQLSRTDYAPDLETLIKHGYLKDGFEDWMKQGYKFEMLEIGQTPKHAMAHENMPKFLAAASPTSKKAKRLFFTIDHLGLVRFGDNAGQAKLGPVWDYQEHSLKQHWENIGIVEGIDY